MNPNNSSTILSRSLTGGIVFMLVLFAFLLLSALSAKKGTSSLTITTFAADTAISISENNKNAVFVGTGTAKLRVLPGTYEVAASDKGHTTTGRVTVTLQKPTTTHLAATQPQKLPSVSDIKFSGMYALINHGITSDQVNNLGQLFFNYKNTTKTVAVDINSINREYRSPDSDTPFKVDFTGTLDGQAFKATITYTTDINNVELTLFNPDTGAVVFDGNSTDFNY